MKHAAAAVAAEIKRHHILMLIINLLTFCLSSLLSLQKEHPDTLHRAFSLAGKRASARDTQRE
jgi:hypothetical protein